MSILEKSGSIHVKCKNCGRPSPADTFIVDHKKKMMVCPSCAKIGKPEPPKLSHVINKAKAQKPTSLHQAPAPSPIPTKKNIIKDVEDEYLDLAYSQKQNKKSQYPRINNEKIRYQCQKCSYHFPYNTQTESPAKCPYCAYSVNFP